MNIPRKRHILSTIVFLYTCISCNCSKWYYIFWYCECNKCFRVRNFQYDRYYRSKILQIFRFLQSTFSSCSCLLSFQSQLCIFCFFSTLIVLLRFLETLQLSLTQLRSYAFKINSFSVISPNYKFPIILHVCVTYTFVV